MKKKLLLAMLILSTSFFAGCIGAQPQGGGIDFVKLLKNPLVMIIVGGVVLWFAFRSSGNK